MNGEKQLEDSNFNYTKCKNTCGSCPFEFESESALWAQAGGCLPELYDVKKWYQDSGRIWACHSEPTTPCKGAIHNLRQIFNIRVKLDKNKPLITENNQGDVI